VITQQLLNIVMLCEIALIAVAVGLYFLHGVWLLLNQKRVLRLTDSARDSLARLVTSGVVDLEQVQSLAKLPHGVQATAFLEVSRNLSGAGKERLRFVAQQVGLLDRARKLCENWLWTRRLRGTRILSHMDVADPIVLKLLLDRNSAVRAQAAEWAAAQPSVPVITAVLRLLADPTTQARFAVQDTLLRMGPVVAGPLATFLERNSGRAAEAGLRVAEALADARFAPAALRLSRTDDVGIRAASAKLLGAVGGAPAAERLMELMQDDASEVRAAAAQSLGRMHHWQAASLLAAGLRDSTWRVRRQSALALRALGAPGALFLRRLTKDGDRFAADMAQQILDLPPAAVG
jgi:HEAT repeat protein